MKKSQVEEAVFILIDYFERNYPSASKEEKNAYVKGVRDMADLVTGKTKL